MIGAREMSGNLFCQVCMNPVEQKISSYSSRLNSKEVLLLFMSFRSDIIQLEI